MTRHLLWFAIPIALVASTGTTRAQYRTAVGVYNTPIPWSYYGIQGGPYAPEAYGGFGAPFYRFGFYPSRIGDNWSNGHTLYGPPVPTYGPTPGAFGGGDAHRHHFTPPGIGYGTGWLGYRTPSPRPKPPTVSVYPGGPAGDGVIVEPDAAAPASPCLRLSIAVADPNAKVTIEGQPTAATGAERLFESPPLEAGKQYRYTVTATWTEDGKERTETKTATGTPGETVAVSFTK